MKLLENHNPLAGCAKDRLICSFSACSSGNMSLSYGDTSRSLNNRKIFLDSLGIDHRSLVCAKQIHANSVKYVNEADKGRGALDYDSSITDTDGLITDCRNVPLAIFTADCLSVFLYDPRRPAIGLIHAGWRSSKENIVLRAIELMRSRFNTRAEELIAGFGPAIGSCCYEVSGEFKGYFPSDLSERSGRLYLDLVSVNKKQLLAAGLKKENISETSPCTHCANGYFSFRREGKDAGRMLSVIMLK